MEAYNGEGSLVAWDEWEQIKAAAAERHSTQMQLNQLPADGRQHSHGWVEARIGWRLGHPAALERAVDPRGRHSGRPEDQHRVHEEEPAVRLYGRVDGGSGLASLGALKTVLTSWEKRLEAVRDECESLEPKLRAVSKDMGEYDSAVAAKVRAVHVSEGGEGW